MNKLQIVNEVLTKLREPTVATTAENPYSALILQFVKETYDEVAKAAEWTWLRRPVTLTGTVINAQSNLFGSISQGMPNIISVYDNTLKYEVLKADNRKKAELRALAYPAVTGPAQFWYQDFDKTTGNLKLVVYPVVPSTNSFVVVSEVLQLVGDVSVADATEIICPGYLLVLGAFEKALLERDGDTAQYQRALSAYTMATASQASMDNAQDMQSTDWVPE